MAEEKQIKINLDPVLYALTNVDVRFWEESFNFLLISGNQARQYYTSPKHAKRIYLLLEKAIGEYEKKFGLIKTQLPEKKESEPEEQIGFGR